MYQAKKEGEHVKQKAKLSAKFAGISAAAASASVFALPLLAFASEGEEKTGIALILPDMNEFIPMLIAFIILVIVLAKFGWPILDNIMVRRDEAIKESMKKAEEAAEESERLLQEYKDQLTEARAEAAKIMEDAKAAGEAAKASIEAKAKAEDDAMIEKAKASIEAEKKAAIGDLRDSAADLSVNVASRIIGQDLSDEEHRRIIERYVNEAGSFNAN